MYTGCLLWEGQFPGIGEYYKVTNHHPGAGEIGSNYVSLQDKIYLISPKACLVQDPATGNTLDTFTLPDKAKWGSLSVWDDYLVATATPIQVEVPRAPKGKGKAPTQDKESMANVPLEKVPGVSSNSDYSSASKTLVVMDRHTAQDLGQGIQRCAGL